MIRSSSIDRAPEASDVHIVLAPMRRRHLGRVLQIESQVYTRPWTRSLFDSELARPESRSYLIARSGAVVVGHCGMLFIEEEGHITTIAVDPAWQRRQIATRLLAAQIRTSRSRGATSLTLEVRVSNTAAQALYGRFGFAPAGIRRSYYPDNGEDAMIMWLHDITEAPYGKRLESVESTVAGSTSMEGVTGGR